VSNPLVRRSLVASAALILCSALPAAAQATRTWVSGVGDDANPCSRTAPCKTFAGAISKTAAGGEISVLDPGGYGAVTITKSITINGDGTLAGILASLTNGIIVNAGANDEVIIRNISINGFTNGLDGVRYLAGGQLTLENVTIYGFQFSTSSQAVDVSLVNSGKLMMHNVSITNCEAGVRLNTTAGVLQATLDNVRIERTDLHAVEAAANAQVTIRNSTLAHNFNAGVRTATGSAVINVEDSTLAYNNAGVNAAVAGSVIRLSNSAIVNNTTGITFVGGATVESAQDNRVAGNGASTAPNGIITLE
jgi:hypothetical protein